MKIIKKANPRECKCEECNCVFELEKGDTLYPYLNDGLRIQYCCYCPECGNKIPVKFYGNGDKIKL